ncbi:MAG: hypothetical protein R3E97_11880 [Candidatus Eisenbacteria bacterium]
MSQVGGSNMTVASRKRSAMRSGGLSPTAREDSMYIHSSARASHGKRSA